MTITSFSFKAATEITSIRRDEPYKPAALRVFPYSKKHRYYSEFDRPKKGFPELKDIMGEDYDNRRNQKTN